MVPMVLLTHGGEANSDGCGLANMLKHFCFAVATDVMCHLEVAKGTCGVGVGVGMVGEGQKKCCFFVICINPTVNISLC